MTHIDRSKEWWLKRIENESDGPIGAGAPDPCPHMDWSAFVMVGNIMASDDDPTIIRGHVMPEIAERDCSFHRNLPDEIAGDMS